MAQKVACGKQCPVRTVEAMERIAIVTGRYNPHPAKEDLLLLDAFARGGVEAQHAEWEDETAAWDSFDAAVIRSTWDYTHDVDGFVEWTKRAGSQTRLLNPSPICEWNSDKHYLSDLAAKDISIVPTSFVEVGSRFVIPDFDEYVIKPVRSGGGRNSGRFTRGRDDEKAMRLANEVLQPGCEMFGSPLPTGRSLMVQPYMPIETAGERGMVFIGGQLSHAIQKGAVLSDGGGRNIKPGTRGFIEAASWSEEEEELADRVLKCIPGGFDKCLYGRVDMVRDASGALRLMELELVEPQLFFDLEPGSAERFVEATLSMISI